MITTRFSALLILVSIATVVSSTPVDIARRESRELADTLFSGVQLAVAQHVDLLPQTEDLGADDDSSIEVDITPSNEQYADSASAEEADGLLTLDEDKDDSGLEYEAGEEEEMNRFPVGVIGKIAGKGLGRLGKKLPKLLGKKMPKLLGKKLPKLKIRFKGRKMPKIKIRMGKGKGKGRARPRPRPRPRQKQSRQRSRRPSRPQQEEPSQGEPDPNPTPAPAPPPPPAPAPEPLPDPSANPVPVPVPVPDPVGGGEPTVNPDPNPVPLPVPVPNPAKGGGGGGEGELALGLARMPELAPEYSYADIVNLCLGKEPKFECFFEDQDSEDAFRNDEEAGAQKGMQWFGWL